MNARMMLMFLVICCAAAAVRADDDAAAPIAPFVNHFTFAVARIEPGAIDFDALQRWGGRALQESKMNPDDRQVAQQGLNNAIVGARKWAAEFTRAGGKSLWIVFTVETFPEEPVFLVAPLDKGSDGQALLKLMGGEPGQQSHAIQTRGAIVAAPDAQSIPMIRAIAPQPRPELARALAEAGDAKVSVAIIPTDDVRRVIGSMIPRLPDGTDANSLTMGVLWAAVTLNPPPGVSMHTVIQAKDAQSAKQLQKLVVSPPAGGQPEKLPWVPSLHQLISQLTSNAQVKGDRVVIDLDERQTTAAATHLGYVLQRTRIQASRQVSASNMRQIMIGMFLYANDHKGEFPDTLEEAAKRAELPPAILTNPDRPGEKPGYVYIKPPEGVKAASDRVVLYENYQKWGEGINVGYADGHVEFWADQKGLEKQIAEARGAKAGPQ